MAYRMDQVTLFPTDDSDFVQFEFGAPSPSLLPAALFTTATALSFDSPSASNYLQYGPLLGCADFRAHLASFLTTEYASRTQIPPSSLVITSGASQSFSNIISLFTTPHTQILIENPTYFLAIRVLEDHGFKRSEMHTIPTDSDGIKTSALRTHLERLSTSPEFQQKLKSMELDSTVSSGDWKRFPFLLYLVPTFSNPTGSTLSHSRRAEIISLAREYNILIVCDDVYQMLDYSSELSHLSLTHFSTPPSLDPPPQRLISYDLETLQPNEFGNVISNCTFSKLFAPGVRLGWIESSPKIIDQYNRSGILYSGGSPNHAMSGIFTSLLKTEYGESGVSLLQMHINKLKKTYAENLVAVCTALEKNLPPNIAKFRIPTGGFFIWIEFDKDKLPDTLELLRAIKPAVDTVSVVDRVEISDGKSKSGVYRGKQIQTQKVSYSPGNIFSPDRTAGNCLRLAFTFYEKEKLVLGVERLCAALKEIL